MSSDGQESNSQQPQQTSAEDQNGESKMMTQAEYLKYKQQDSNINNYYGFSREATCKPVAWVRATPKIS